MSIVLGSVLGHKSIADVTRRKGRTLVVVLSIFIGVFGLTGINVFSFKLLDAYAHQQDRSHFPDIVFSVDDVAPAQLSQLAATMNVQAVQVQMMATFRWQAASEPVTMNVTAFQDPQRAELGGFDLTSGHLPGSGEIVLEMSDLELHSFSVGSMIRLDGPKGPVQLRVVGTGETPGLPSVKGSKVAQGYMSMNGLAQLLGTSAANSIAIKVHHITIINDTARTLSHLLQKQQVVVQDTVVQSGIGTQLGIDFLIGFFNLVRMLAAGAIIVSCFLIVNTLNTLIAEQMKIIGTMKAIGGTRRAIINSYLVTVLIYSLLGTFLGLTLGIIIGYLGAWQFAKLKLLYLGPFSIPTSPRDAQRDDSKEGMREMS